MRSLTALLGLVLLLAVACDPPATVPATFAVPTAGPGGQEDLRFGADDLTVVHVGDDIAVRDVLVDPDGRLLVLGRAELDDRQTGFLLRFDTEGTLDPTFGDGGIATVERWQPSRMALADDGTVTVVGDFHQDLAIQHLSSAGAADADPVSIVPPAPDGMVVVGVPVTDVLVDQDGAVTVAGGISVNEAGDVGGCCAIEPETIPFTARFDRDGAADPGYGQDGFDLGERSVDARPVAGLPGSPERQRHGSTEGRREPAVSVTVSDDVITVGTLVVEVGDDEFEHYLWVEMTSSGTETTE